MSLNVGKLGDKQFGENRVDGQVELRGHEGRWERNWRKLQVQRSGAVVDLRDTLSGWASVREKQ